MTPAARRWPSGGRKSRPLMARPSLLLNRTICMDVIRQRGRGSLKELVGARLEITDVPPRESNVAEPGGVEAASGERGVRLLAIPEQQRDASSMLAQIPWL